MVLRMSPHQARALGVQLSGPSGVGQQRAREPVDSSRRSLCDGPQARLTRAALARFPGGKAEYPCIPGRRFRLDLAWPDARPPVAVELDGWAFHGKYKSDFLRDRRKRNLLALNGWLVLAFPARDIHRQLDDVLDMIGRALQQGGGS